jgi:hypothetical protein
MSQNNKKILHSRSRSQSRSPKKLLKKKQLKTESQMRKQEKKNFYNREVDTLAKQQKYLNKLTEKYAKVKPSHQLVFSKIDDTRVFTRQELAAAQSEYNKKLLGLKKLYIEGTKHSRVSILPNSFKAAYTPIKVGPVFVDFLSPDGKNLPNFGLLPNDEGSDWIKGSSLLDALPRAREGFFLKNSLTLLMYIYAVTNNLKSKVQSEGQKNIPDDRMNRVFGKSNALYYHEPGQSKVLMTTAGKKLSTYDVVSGKNNEFNPSKIENYYFQSIQSLNIYENADLSKSDLEKLSDDKIRNQMLKEFFIIEKANKLLKKK